MGLYLLLLVDLEGGKNNILKIKMDLFLGDSFEENIPFTLGDEGNISFYHSDEENMSFSFADEENLAFSLGDEENMMDLLERSMQEIGQSEISFEDRQNSYSLDNNNNLIDTENILQNYDDSNEEDENMYTLVNPIKIEPETTDLQMDRPDEIQNISEKEDTDDMSDDSNFSDNSSDSGIETIDTPTKLSSDALYEMPVKNPTTIIYKFIVPKTTKDVTSNIGQKKVKVSVLRNNFATKDVSKSGPKQIIKKDKNTPIRLNRDEMRVYRKEGIRLPQKFPLSRMDEHNLKLVRRKIRNRMSAQESRKRKKNYVAELEAKVKAFSVEKNGFLKKIEQLEAQNMIFVNQLNQFQEITLC